MLSVLRRFEREEERQFQAEYARRSIPFVRVSLPIAVVLFLLFLSWDSIIDPSALPYTLAVRLAFCAVAIGVLLLTFTDWFVRRAQIVLSLTLIAGATSVLVVLYIVPDGFTLGIGGVLLVIMYAFGFFRLLLVPAAIACVVIVTISNGLIWSAGSAPFVYANFNLFVISACIIGLCYAALLEWMERNTFVINLALAREKDITDAMLRNFLPDRIVERLKQGETNVAEAVGEATVLFADLVGFTGIADRVSPGHLIEILRDVFSRFDEIADQKGVEKVKTIGDSYMVVGGLRNPSSDSTANVAEFAIEALNAIDQIGRQQGQPLQIRIGIATGALVSGVIGTKVPIFDLWGDTVNLASRLESEGVPNAIHVSESTYWRLHTQYEFEDRGEIDLKGGARVHAYLLRGRKLIRPADGPNSVVQHLRSA